ncbi:BolA family transcriptional regulator [Gammaproteobacteria bacterium]|nr:BolA family transcriptional regulator [Gammaproteobacteria bacterium]
MSQFKALADQIKTECNLASIEIIDESYLHRHHQQYQKGKAHLKLVLTPIAPFNRLSLHRKIMKIAFSHMPLHAVAIKIQSP